MIVNLCPNLVSLTQLAHAITLRTCMHAFKYCQMHMILFSYFAINGFLMFIIGHWFNRLWQNTYTCYVSLTASIVVCPISWRQKVSISLPAGSGHSAHLLPIPFTLSPLLSRIWRKGHGVLHWCIICHCFNNHPLSL